MRFQTRVPSTIPGAMNQNSDQSWGLKKSVLKRAFLKHRHKKTQRVKAGLLYWMDTVYLTVVGVGGIAVIGNVTNTGKLGDALHQGFLNAIFQG